MSDQVVTLDVDEALERFGGNRQVFFRLLLRFLELNADVGRKAKDAVASADCEQIALFFHSIKGGAANLSAKRLAEKCAVLEKLAKAGDIDAVKRESGDFSSFFDELKAEVERVSSR